MLVSAMTGGIGAASVGCTAGDEHAANSRLKPMIMGTSFVFILSTPLLMVLTIDLPIIYSFPEKDGVD
jgi:hypothetical protein